MRGGKPGTKNGICSEIGSCGTFNDTTWSCRPLLALHPHDWALFHMFGAMHGNDALGPASCMHHACVYCMFRPYRLKKKYNRNRHMYRCCFRRGAVGSSGVRAFRNEQGWHCIMGACVSGCVVVTASAVSAALSHAGMRKKVSTCIRSMDLRMGARGRSC